MQNIPCNPQIGLMFKYTCMVRSYWVKKDDFVTGERYLDISKTILEELRRSPFHTVLETLIIF